MHLQDAVAKMQSVATHECTLAETTPQYTRGMIRTHKNPSKQKCPASMFIGLGESCITGGGASEDVGFAVAANCRRSARVLHAAAAAAAAAAVARA